MDSFGTLRATWTCASIMPGRTVDVLRSITRAPAGTATLAPTSAMRSPRISTTWLVSIVPVFASKSRPARMAVTVSWAAVVANNVSASTAAAQLKLRATSATVAQLKLCATSAVVAPSFSSASWFLNIIPSNIDDEVPGDGRADVFCIVDLVRADDTHVAGAKPVRFAGNRELHHAFANQHHLFTQVLVGRMVDLAGRDIALMR